MEVVSFLPQLGTALWNLKVMYDQHKENGNEIKELQSFIQDYDQQIPILRERFQKGGANVMGISTFKNLEKDVKEAIDQLGRWSRNKNFFRVFNSVERMQQLGKLHSKVMGSVQKSLGIATLSTLLDLQATQATILESNAKLKSLLITSIGSTHGMLPANVRDEVVEASTSSFGDPKFWEDVLAVVDKHNAGVSSLEDKNMYEDSITTNLMIDPVVASDGNTYCRWTIIDNNLTKNPFNVDEDLTIVIDNLTFRRGLFEKFPEQAQIFRQRRNEYRSHAFALKAQGLWSDAVLALHYVFQWDKRDVECVEALEEVQGALKVAKEKYLQPCKRDVECVEVLEHVQEVLHKTEEKYLQPSVGLSNEVGNGEPSGSSIHVSEVGTCMEHVAYKLFPSLSSSTPEVRQQAAYAVCQWSKDFHFQYYIVENGGIPLLATLLPSSDQITQEHIVSIILDLCESSNKHRTIFDALEPIVEVFNEGSMKARERAAKIFFNLSTNPKRRSIVGNSRAMSALVASLGNGTQQVQQIASGTLNNLFFHTPNRTLAVKVGVVSILLRLIHEQPTTMLGEALALLSQLLSSQYQLECIHAIIIKAPPTTWLDIMVSESPMNQERAASILYSLCCNDQQYRHQVRECHVLEQITESTTLSKRTKYSFFGLLESNVSNKHNCLGQEIPFPFPKKY